MFVASNLSWLMKHADVYHSMLRDRGRQFVTRHRWTLELDESGLERDAFDDGLTQYCIWMKDGRHAASLRLRRAKYGSMAEVHFPALWRRELSSAVEITRLCASPYLAAEDQSRAVSDLLIGLCRYCQRYDINSLFGIVFPSALRAIRRSGWAADVLESHETSDGPLLLAQWKPSELVAWNIEERTAKREENRSRSIKISERLVA